MIELGARFSQYMHSSSRAKGISYYFVIKEVITLEDNRNNLHIF